MPKAKKKLSLRDKMIFRFDRQVNQQTQAYHMQIVETKDKEKILKEARGEKHKLYVEKKKR